MMTDITYYVTFKQKDGDIGMSTDYATLREAFKAIEDMKPDFECTSLELVWNITDLIKEVKK